MTANTESKVRQVRSFAVGVLDAVGAQAKVEVHDLHLPESGLLAKLLDAHGEYLICCLGRVEQSRLDRFTGKRTTERNGVIYWFEGLEPETVGSSGAASLHGDADGQASCEMHNLDSPGNALLSRLLGGQDGQLICCMASADKKCFKRAEGKRAREQNGVMYWFESASKPKVPDFQTSAYSYPPDTESTVQRTSSSSEAASEESVSPSQVEEGEPVSDQDKFDCVRADVGASFIGQEDYLDALCNAFKRPYLITPESGKPKNTLFVLGPSFTGRHHSIDLVCKAMLCNGLGNDAGEIKKKTDGEGGNATSRIDLSRYASADEFKLFLFDLYSALCSPAIAVVFDGFEKAHFTCIEALSAIVQEGRYGLGSRYRLQDGALIESSGVFVTGIVDSLDSKGKVFVFVAECSESKIVDVFGPRFMSSISDIIRIGDYSEREVRAFCAMAIDVLVGCCGETMGVSLASDETLLDYCVALYSPRIGFRQILKFTERRLYNALGSYVLAVGKPRSRHILLSVKDGEPFARIDGKIVSLSAYMPMEYKADLSEVETELEAIIGLTSVKERIRSIKATYEANKLRQQAGHPAANVSLHMVFTGNPDTGKTTVARIVAKYLRALGVLSSGHLREVSRGDLVARYLGQTASQTRAVVESALGGVLFIDEAYSLYRGVNDSYGLEAIDTLVKCIEDNRDDLVVILAGYTDEMAQFLESNPGLRSRFPYVIEFPDYTAAEMVDIAESIARSKGYAIDDECNEGLLALFERNQVKGRNDSGNGRLARNVVEGAIARQAERIVTNPSDDLSLLTEADFDFPDYSTFDLEEELLHIVGLDQVKELIRTQQKLLVAEKKRRLAGYSVDTSQTLNMIFTGNPGTGKTTVARIMARMFKDMGYLKTGQLIETDRAGLVAGYIGQTAIKTTKKFNEALGGVLFIDEAYALSRGDDNKDFGREAIDTLVKLIEDYRGEVVVILAGYTKEMARFLASNSGLESRFPLRMEFPDYTHDELVQIAEGIIDSKGFVLSEGAQSGLRKALEDYASGIQGVSGNGRMARNFVEDVLRNQSARIASMDADAEGLFTVLDEDFPKGCSPRTGFDLEEELSHVVGLEEVKQFIRSLQARLRMETERKRIGLPTSQTQTLHMVFTGNPGTGKTMMARTIAKTLSQVGVIASDKLVETDRAGLVAGYIGQTAIKTTEKFNEALGGVLFIDEAYALSRGDNNKDFGREAIDTLVKLIDDNRDRIVVILAGYTKEMEGFLDANPGLKSRFPNVIEFVDYTAEDLVKICLSFYENGGYIVKPEAIDKMRLIFETRIVFEQVEKGHSFGNGRYARNLFERSLNSQAMRLSSKPDLSREELITIEASDIEEA